MAQSAMARFEGGRDCTDDPVVDRLACVIEADLVSM